MARLIFAFLAVMVLAVPARAQDLAQEQMNGLPPRAAPTNHVQVETLPVVDATPKFDAARATASYLGRINGAARARSDAYFEDGYWLMLVDLVWALAIAGVLLWLRVSAGLRDWIAARTRNRTNQILFYTAAYVALTAAASFPLTVYEGYVREHAYGLSNQNFAAWFSDFATGLAISLVASLIFVPLLYAAIRRAGRSWWLWGASLAIAFQIVTAVIYPLFIAPLFNHYTPLPESNVESADPVAGARQ